jgi:branched-chain amino acid transport system ATP-binding protein
MTLLEVSALWVRYGGAEAVKGISLRVEEGEITTIIGSNGAGKTTTLRTISGLKRPASGEIRFHGELINLKPSQQIVEMGIGHVPQGRYLFPHMGVLENLRLGAFLQRDKRLVQNSLQRVFQTFPVLNARKKQLAGTLSGGEQQMLAIARALMGNPKLLLLDEPSIGLAPIVVREIGKVALEINKHGTSILLVEQNSRLALRLARKGYVLETGKIVLEGDTGSLLHNEGVLKAYLGQ